ncbi:coiled-coil domain-containing protein 25 [Magnaporthiopsis poae ATCC 64411]|uniref:Coiled-coil domain-containing protein 25 n=1 Tax=Magnaporthiopsis poae (strain ATCC 64411 / 73-15) TaxID=644358 RepID=A0A0C4EAP5_MAGP6|nr:coiled-coil domain-containing protein 25 [Magnaporthiopsis poae ATCC 64411]
MGVSTRSRSAEVDLYLVRLVVSAIAIGIEEPGALAGVARDVKFWLSKSLTHFFYQLPLPHTAASSMPEAIQEAAHCQSRVPRHENPNLSRTFNFGQGGTASEVAVMVYYFTSKAVDPAAFIYVGKDKFEILSRVGIILLQFHVDKLSSAHIYLRLREGETWDAIPEPLLQDLAQLTKANSIEGNKKDNVTIIYTPWSNLKKDGSMDVGQVSFHDQKKVKRILVPQRENPIVNRLNKTKEERHPDLKQEKDDHLRELRKRDQSAQQQRRKEEARIAKERSEKKWQKDHAYDDIFTEENMEASSNQNRDENWEDDFM